MPGSKRLPQLKRHKSTGHAYCRANGRQIWFGRYDDPETEDRFRTFLARFLASGCELPEEGRAYPALTVSDLSALYLVFAGTYYRKPDGTATQEVQAIVYALRPLLQLYASLRADSFDLRRLKQVREAMVASGLARTTTNIRIAKLVRMYRWGVQEEHVPASVYASLRALQPLKRGRSNAREPVPVKPVGWADVEKTLPFLPAPVRGLVLLQWHTGMRPGEATQVTAASIERGGDVWLYRPPLGHKTEHHGKERLIGIGPRAQAVLEPLLLRVPRPEPSQPLFSPKDAMGRKRSTSKRIGDAYSRSSYCYAVRRGCKRADVTPWSPNQLRHACASRLAADLGVEAARVVLGHSDAGVTASVYVERDLKKAFEVMRELG